MKIETHHKSKNEFQLERLILFSDAVFAIAITLLVIEIKVPEIEHDVTEQKLIESLAHMIPKFIGFIMSFLLIGQYWTVHHRMFGYVRSYTQRLLWLNLLLLLAVVLMPFSTAFWSEYIYKLYKSPLIIYVCNICFLGFMNFILWRYISTSKHHLSEGLTPPLARYFSMRSLAVPSIFLIMAVVYLFIGPIYAVWIPPFIPVIMRIVFGRQKKKLNI